MSLVNFGKPTGQNERGSALASVTLFLGLLGVVGFVAMSNQKIQDWLGPNEIQQFAASASAARGVSNMHRFALNGFAQPNAFQFDSELQEAQEVYVANGVPPTNKLPCFLVYWVTVAWGAAQIEAGPDIPYCGGPVDGDCPGAAQQKASDIGVDGIYIQCAYDPGDLSKPVKVTPLDV